MIMVRRRGRPAKEPNPNDDGTEPEMLLSGEPMSAAAAVAGAGLLEDQYFASPKRKDCRLMKVNENLNAIDVAAIVGVNGDCAPDCNGAANNNNSNKGKANYINGKATKSERAGSAGRTIGVPLATRSQTRTIENYFRANAAAKYANKMTTNQTTEEQKTISSTTSEATTTTAIISTSDHQQTVTEDELPVEQEQEVLLYDSQSIASSGSPQHQHDEADNEHETENAAFSLECTLHEDIVRHFNGIPAPIHSADFQTHRSALRDSHSSSHSSSSAATDNIFLQEPVLTLDIDRTPTKASSIKINKSFELAGAVFSSPPSGMLSACLLNGRFNQIVTLNGQCEPQPVNFGAAVALAPPQRHGFDLDQHDSSSCDSGVACCLTVPAPTAAAADSPAVGARRSKPATPHRILCPSPIKTLPRDPMLLPGARKMAAATKCDSLSPRKSPRKLTASSAACAAAACQSRRRLNAPKTQAPHQHQPGQQTSVTADDVIVVLDDDEDVDEDDVHALLKTAEEVEHLNKSRTAMNNNNNNNNNHNHSMKPMLKPAAPKKTSTKGAKAKSQTTSKLKMPLSLAAANGNRELDEFFPVRRSVRKTKTVVKEEMMRNLEQAVLEERADGLVVRDFEGKGRGIVADRAFKRNEFVVEYVGDLIAINEATERERRYALDENAGCYMYYFKHKNQQYCIDATVDTGKLGRLINHSRNGNLMTKVVVIKQRPHLVLLAKDDIEPGEELTYDYGDRSKEALLHHPWLAF